MNVEAVLDRARRALVPIFLFSAALLVLGFVNRLEPVAGWLIWPYLGFCAVTTAWVIGCASLGHAGLRLLPPLGLKFRERLLFDFAVGVLLFVIGLFLVGLLGGLRWPFYVAYPVAVSGIGLAVSFRDWRRAWRHFRGARRRARVPPSLVHRGALVLGTLGLAVVYLAIMAPENVAFDARSYHLPLAEHYAAAGRIARFPEGWFPGGLPHFASWLYTWPFTLRNANLFWRVELAAHLELALFIATIFSAPLLVEALRPGTRARGAWAVFFLFPGLFLYDSSLGVAADHVLAFWGAPLAIATVRFARQPANRARGALLGLMMAGAFLTKYQAVYMLAPTFLVLAFIVGRELWRARRSKAQPAESAAEGPNRARALLTATGAIGLAGLLGTAPQWLGHLVWYGNPVYPMLYKIIPSHPMVAGWRGMWPDTQFVPDGTFVEKIRDSALSAVTFSFVPHDWWPFHRDVPVFGFLFTLTLPLLLVGRKAAAARILAAGTLLGVFIWYWTYHEDRYLQALLPWMVGTTAVGLQIAWASGAAARVGTAVLVALQVIWGGDVPWLPSHGMSDDVPALRTLRRFSSTFKGETAGRYTFDTGFEPLEHALPKDAYVLLHEEYVRLGLNRRGIQDSFRLQAAIDYRALVRPDRIHDLLKGMGATHLVWGSSSPNREITTAAELAFWGYALRFGEERRNFGPYTVAKVPERRPPAREPGSVAYVGCNVVRSVPFAEIDALDGGRPDPQPGDPAAVVAGAEFVVLESRCESKVTPQMMAPFEETPRYGDLRLWVRRL